MSDAAMQAMRAPGELGASPLRAAKAEARADTRAVGATRTRGVGGECSARGRWVVERMGPDAMHKVPAVCCFFPTSLSHQLECAEVLRVIQ